MCAFKIFMILLLLNVTCLLTILILELVLPEIINAIS